MAEERKKIRKTRVGARVGKNPTGSLQTTLDSSQYRGGGSKIKASKGKVIRKPSSKIRYTKKSD